jgi:hypothetical protein
MWRFLTFILVSLLTPISTMAATMAAECSMIDGSRTCIDVRGDDENQLVITVKKARAGSKSTTPGKVVRKTSTVKKPEVQAPWIPWLPKPTIKRTTPPETRTQQRSRRPQVSQISASEVMDQVRSILPTGGIITQPWGSSLLHQPTYFMTSTPEDFRAVVRILGIPISLHLTSSFLWEFGDGEVFSTRSSGTPYPIPTITHIYRSPGEKKIVLKVLWTGSWSAAGVKAPIQGKIHQILSREILVQEAFSSLTN